MFKSSYKPFSHFNALPQTSRVAKLTKIGPMCEAERPLWKDLLLVTVPTFVGSVLPLLLSIALSPDEPPPQNPNAGQMPGYGPGFGHGHHHHPFPSQPVPSPIEGLPNTPSTPPSTEGPEVSFKSFTASRKGIKA